MFAQRSNGIGANAGVKRRMPNTGFQPMKIHRPQDPVETQARKDARKEANAEKLASAEEEYKNIAHEIAPVVASIIDSFGGVSTLSVISTDPELKNAIERIPSGHSKKLKKILEMFPEHIVSLEDGSVVTALGYENGIVSADGIVDKEKKQEYAKAKKEHDKTQNVNVQPSGESMSRLQRALSRLTNVGAKEPEKPYQDALAELQHARFSTFGKNAGGVKLAINKADPAKTERDCKQFAQYVRRFMVTKGYEAGAPMKMSEIASDAEAKRMHAEIANTSGKKYKMGKILTDHAEWFALERNELVGATEITLTVEGASITAQRQQQSQQSRPFGGKGKGKGTRH